MTNLSLIVIRNSFFCTLGLLGTPVRMHAHAIIQSVNHVAGVQCMKKCRYASKALVHIKKMITVIFTVALLLV